MAKNDLAAVAKAACGGAYDSPDSCCGCDKRLTAAEKAKRAQDGLLNTCDNCVKHIDPEVIEMMKEAQDG